MNLLGWHWLTELYRFQVHNSTTHHLYTVLCVHHPTSSLPPSPFIPPFPPPPPPILSFQQSPQLLSGSMSFFSFHFIFCSIPSTPLRYLNPSTPLTQLPHSCQLDLYVYESVSILLISWFCSLESTYEWNHMVFVFLWLAYFI